MLTVLFVTLFVVCFLAFMFGKLSTILLLLGALAFSTGITFWLINLVEKKKYTQLFGKRR